MEKFIIIDEPFYNFKDAPTDIKSIIHCINLHGENLIGAEIGVHQANSFLTLLQNCPNIDKLYGVDSYEPYADYLKDIPDGNPAYTIDKKQIDYIKLTSYHHQEYYGHKEKIIFYEMDSNEASKKFDDNYLDFIFLDTYMSYNQCKTDIETWYSKIKPGGIFAGHDWNSVDVQKAVIEFRKLNNIENIMSTYDKTWIWKK